MTPPEKLIATRYGQYRSQLSDIWATYCFVEDYLPLLHEQIKTGSLAPVPTQSFTGAAEFLPTKAKTFGTISHVRQVVNPRRALVDLVSHTEDYLQYAATVVYRRFPEKLTSDGSDSPERVDKLVDVILKSGSRDEMIEKLAEEKVRSIFYGNPVYFFTKDRARLGFGPYFASCHKSSMVFYQDILACRNAFIHNDGRVDRKFMKECSIAGYKLGQKIRIDSEFIRNSLIRVRGLTANATFLIIRNTLKVEPANQKLLSIRRAFNNQFEENKPSEQTATPDNV